MENQKDNNNQTNQSNRQAQKSPLNPEELLFANSSRDLYIYRKNEKLCSAIHMLTGFFNEREPLRLSLREKAIELIPLSLSFTKNSDLQNLVNSMSIRLAEIKSLLHTAFFAGLMSEMNYTILKEELDSLMLALEAKRQTLFVLSSSFLDVPLSKEKELNIAQFLRDSSLEPSVPVHQNERKNSPADPVISKPVSSSNITSQNTTNDRADKILFLLKDGKQLSIRDFSISIKGCSEKTLQRELLKLVAEGKILKRGERRWSSYSLI